MRWLLIVDTVLLVAGFSCLFYFGNKLIDHILREINAKTEQIQALSDANTGLVRNDLETFDKNSVERLASLSKRVRMLGDEQIAQHQKMADFSEVQYDEVRSDIKAVHESVKSQAAELNEQANQVKIHAQQIIDARNQHEGNVHVPRAKCSQCERVVYRFGSIEGKTVCQDCISLGKGLPPAPSRPPQTRPVQTQTAPPPTSTKRIY